MVHLEVVIVYTLNLAQLPAGCGEEIRPSIDFISWICEQKIGNWQQLMLFIALDPEWHKQELIPFECSEEEAVMIMLRWS
jgi:hypothetical protein